MSDTPNRPDPDFSLAGVPVYEWLGHEPHEATIKAAVQAVALPDEPIIIGRFSDPALPAAQFASTQRRVLRIWFQRTHAGTPGRLRLALRTRLDPETAQDVKVAEVTYDSRWTPKAKVTADG